MGIVEIYKLKEPYKLSDKTIQLAMELLGKLKGEGRGTLLDSMCATALYAAAKHNDEFIPLEIILNHIQGNLRECKTLLNKLRAVLKDEYNITLTPVSGEDYVKYYFRVTGIDDEDLLNKIVREVNKIRGGNPKTNAGAVLYTTLKDAGMKHTQRGIANLLGVSDVSLRKKYAELYG